MKRGHIAAVVAEASHPAPGRAVTADPAVLAARTIAGVDIGAARRAAADFLSALGIDVDREDLRETPARMARAYAELFSTRPLRLTTFANDEGYDELVLARAIPVPHRLRASPAAVLRPGARRLPARRAHRRAVQAGPAGGALRGQAPGAGAADQAGRRVPGRPAPGRGVGVVLEAGHSCMTLRGVRAHGAKTVTSALPGTLRADARSRAEFFALAGVPR